MAASEEAFGAGHPSTLTRPTVSSPIKTELKEVSPGVYGHVAVVEDDQPTRIEFPDGSYGLTGAKIPEGTETRHAELSEIAHHKDGGPHHGFTVAVHDFKPEEHDHGPDA